jgi:septal ring-binding cell division protein DamX
VLVAPAEAEPLHDDEPEPGPPCGDEPKPELQEGAQNPEMTSAAAPLALEKEGKVTLDRQASADTLAVDGRVNVASPRQARSPAPARERPASSPETSTPAKEPVASPTPNSDSTIGRRPGAQPLKLESVLAAFQFQASGSRRRKLEVSKLQ